MTAPILQSLLLADHVYRDQATGKHIICGVFSTIYFSPNAQQEKPGGGPVGNGISGISPGGNQGIGGNLGAGGAGGGLGRPDPGSSDRGKAVPGGLTPVGQPIQNLMQAGSPYVYFSITELRGRKTFEVRYVDLHENRSLFQAEVPIECDDPLRTIEIAMPLPRLPLSAWEERLYALEVLCEGQLLGSHRVQARLNQQPPPPAA